MRVFEIKVCKADELRIPKFNAYLLDIEVNGSVRKPDSLFMEAVKKETKLPDKLNLILNKDIELYDLIGPNKTSNDKLLNIVHLSMQDWGGAGKAAYRLHKGLKSIGINSTLLVLNKKSGDPSVKALPSVYSGKMSSCLDVPSHNSPIWNQQVENWYKLLSAYPKRPAGLEMFTDAESSVRLDLIREIQAADIIHLHWVAGVMDYANAVLALNNKRIVWTLHDMNPFTGGCHYAGDCQQYKTFCQKCPQLGSDNANDLSHQIWTKKLYTSQNLNMDIVTPSRWLGRCAGQSSILSRFPVHIIPNGFPLDTFKPYPKAQIRNNLNISKSAKVILFGADDVTNQRKGFVYLLKALNRFQLKSGHDYILLTFELSQPVSIASASKKDFGRSNELPNAQSSAVNNAILRTKIRLNRM